MPRFFPALLLLSLAAMPAHAYIDPNLGSMLLQGLIAGIAAVGVTAKLYWHRILAFFKKPETEEEQEEDVEQDQAP